MKKVMMVVGAVLYVLSPLDIVPDLIPVLGWLDDLGVLALLVRYLAGTPGEPRPLGA